MLHEYVDSHDQLLFYMRRHERKGDKGKQFYPLTYGRLGGRLGWHDKTPISPKPLYGLNRLSHAAPDAIVLLCEGEKSADSAQRMYPDMVGMSWMGGASADEHADLAPLLGRSVILWGDADAPGRGAVGRLAKRLPDARIVNTDGLPEGLDAADLEVSGDEDASAWLRARTVLPGGAGDPQRDAAFAPIPWTYRDPTKIPPREWFLGTMLLRCYATVLGSMGGVGKTAYAIALGLAFITGRHDILDQHVFQTGKVWFITLEDDREELERRIAAAMIAHNIDPNEVEGRLFVNTASERPAGDNVQAAKAWKFPTAFDGINLSLLQRIFTRLRGEPEPGWFYSPDQRAKFWAGTVIMEETGRSKNQAGKVLKTWLQNGVVAEADCKTPSRNSGTKVVLNDAKAAEILAPMRALVRSEE